MVDKLKAYILAVVCFGGLFIPSAALAGGPIPPPDDPGYTCVETIEWACTEVFGFTICVPYFSTVCTPNQ